MEGGKVKIKDRDGIMMNLRIKEEYSNAKDNRQCHING